MTCCSANSRYTAVLLILYGYGLVLVVGVGRLVSRAFGLMKLILNVAVALCVMLCTDRVQLWLGAIVTLRTLLLTLSRVVVLLFV